MQDGMSRRISEATAIFNRIVEFLNPAAVENNPRASTTQRARLQSNSIRYRFITLNVMLDGYCAEW
jgi:hypothetical protein